MITGDELYKIAHEPYKTYQRMISRYKEKNIQVKKDKRGNRDVYLFKIM